MKDKRHCGTLVYCNDCKTYSRDYHVYEERVWGMGNPDIGVMEFDTEKATLLVACDTLKEAKRWVKEDFEGGVVLSYLNVDGVLTDERFEYYDERRGSEEVAE